MCRGGQAVTFQAPPTVPGAPCSGCVCGRVVFVIESLPEPQTLVCLVDASGK